MDGKDQDAADLSVKALLEHRSNDSSPKLLVLSAFAGGCGRMLQHF